jgi:GT2 family glycosyltransferase
MMEPLTVSIAVATYSRDRVLIETIGLLLALEKCAAEILVIDQTICHAPETEASLRIWAEVGKIKWVRLPKPTIPGAMNHALLHSNSDITLFLDDDIVPSPNLVAAHTLSHQKGHRLVAGRVLQPWDDNLMEGLWDEKQFASAESREVDQFIGCNFSIRTEDAIKVGGFDENFVRVAYNYECEFADRWREHGLKIQFEPQAWIRHLRVPSGGTRSFGDHLRTLTPAHSVGTYYYLLRSKRKQSRIKEFIGRPFRAITTKHHLRRPWWIPVTLIAELLGMLWALALSAYGPRYCNVCARNPRPSASSR